MGLLCRSRWADSSVIVIARGNPSCCLARQARNGAGLHQQQERKPLKYFVVTDASITKTLLLKRNVAFLSQKDG